MPKAPYAVPLPRKGKLVTFTFIHNLPGEFEVPRLGIGIVELENGVRLTCMVAEAPPDEVKIGTEVELVFRRIQGDPEWEVLQYGYKAQVVGS